MSCKWGLLPFVPLGQSTLWESYHLLLCLGHSEDGHFHNDDQDPSPPRKARHDTPDASPPRRVRHGTPEPSPPRKVCHDTPDPSPTRRVRHDTLDPSPPRRVRHDTPDPSPPRRVRHDSDASPPRRSHCNSSAVSPKRGHHGSSGTSSPRQAHNHSPAAAQHRRTLDSSGAQHHRRARHDSPDLELPKAKSSKAAERPSSKTVSQSGLGPPHPSLSTNSKYEHDSDLSPPRKRQTKAHFGAKKQLDSKGECNTVCESSFVPVRVRTGFF